MNSPISDLIIRIKNAYLARLDEMNVPYSRYREAVVMKLKQEGFLGEVHIEGEATKKSIVCSLQYKGSMPAVTDVKAFSTPGRRWYIGKGEIKRVKGGFGRSFISSNKGIVTGEEAKKLGLGGELLFEIW
jgi:small subunit ribosomal protein S8